jgi:hypothetical protein
MAKLITQAEAAKMRGVSVSAIYYLIQRGRVRSVEKFGKVLVYEDEVKNYEPHKPGPKPAKKPADTTRRLNTAFKKAVESEQKVSKKKGAAKKRKG